MMTSSKPICLLLALVCLMPLSTLAQEIPVHECDRLAAHPSDINKVTPGVEWELLEPEPALMACERAVRRYPEVTRFTYQYARAFHKAGGIEEALNYYRSAAEKGYASALYNLYLMYNEGQGVSQDSKAAFKWVKLAAEQGHARAQLTLGWMYLNGQGVTQDSKAAFKWYRLAAEQGDARAQFILGSMYNKGQGVAQDSKAAFKWVKLAADQGDAGAQFILGLMYDEGRGISRDKVQAYVWVSLSAARRYVPSKKRINSLASDMTSEQIVEAQRIAWEWEKIHALPLSAINFEPKSSFVIIDQSASAFTVFTGISKESSDQEIDEINSKISEQGKTVIVSWSEFIENVRNFTNSTIIKHEYMKYGVVDGIVCLVGNAPGTPWGLIWNGGIALTSNDYRHAKDIYQLYQRDPSKYEQDANRDPRADPINPGGHLPVFGCI